MADNDQPGEQNRSSLKAFTMDNIPSLVKVVAEELRSTLEKILPDKENHSQGDLREIHNTGNEVQSANQNPNIFRSMPNEETDVKGFVIVSDMSENDTSEYTSGSTTATGVIFFNSTQPTDREYDVEPLPKTIQSVEDSKILQGGNSQKSEKSSTSGVKNNTADDHKALENNDRSNKELAESVWKIFKEYYTSIFIKAWKRRDDDQKDQKDQKDSSKLKVVAALIVERTHEGSKHFEIATLGQGTKHRKKSCVDDQYDDPWHSCDGHAEAVCFQFANEFLLTEMHNICCKGKDSIFELCDDLHGFKLKDNIRFHLFVSYPPCGFMKDTNTYLISWKEFESAPHCPECSSKILLNSFLGIQGYLSHLMVTPIYISHIIFNHSGITSFSTYMLAEMESIGIFEDGYSFHKPIIMTIEKDMSKLGSWAHPTKKDCGTTHSSGILPYSAGPGMILSNYSVIKNQTRLGKEKTSKIESMMQDISKKMNLDVSILQQRLFKLKNAQNWLYQYFKKKAFEEQSKQHKKRLKLKAWNITLQNIGKGITNQADLRVDQLLKQVTKYTEDLKELQKILDNNLKYEKMSEELDKIISDENLLAKFNMIDCDWERYITYITSCIRMLQI